MRAGLKIVAGGWADREFLPRTSKPGRPRKAGDPSAPTRSRPTGVFAPARKLSPHAQDFVDGTVKTIAGLARSAGCHVAPVPYPKGKQPGRYLSSRRLLL